MAEIKEWGKIFEDPAALSKKIAESWLFHAQDIKNDFLLMEIDWHAGDYYKSGEDLADALQLAVGDVQPAITAQMFPNMDVKPEL